MKRYQFVNCSNCNIEYKIQWEDDDFEEPTRCAGCGEDYIEIIHSGVLV
jgi:hypothetical protein